MKTNRFLQATIVLTLLAIAQNSRAAESVRVYSPETRELSIVEDRLSDLEQVQGDFRQDFTFAFPPTRKLAVKIAVYRDGKLDKEASSLFHIYGIPNREGNSNAENSGFFSLTQSVPQPPDEPRNGATENSWYIKVPNYSYGFREGTPVGSTDSQGSADFAETAELRRGKVVMKQANGKFRLNVWVQTVPRRKSEPRYGTKRFAVTMPAKSKSSR